MRPKSNRLNAYMLRSGRVVLRHQRFSLSGGRRLAAGLTRHDLPALKTVLLPGPARDFFVPEARARHGDDAALLTLEGWRKLAEIYKRRIAEALDRHAQNEGVAA